MLKKILLLLSLVFLFFGCQTEMQITDDIAPYGIEESNKMLDMEFIGFKSGDAQWGTESRVYWGGLNNTPSLRSIGSKLQFAGIAMDESSHYFGVYSFQELAAYKNKHRYITFIEIPELNMAYSDNENSMVRVTGAILCACAIFPIGLPMCFMPYRSKIYMSTSANIFVYDSQSQEIVYKKAISITDEKKFKGLWRKTSEVGKSKIYDYFASVISNSILEEYSNIYKSPLFQ